MKRRGVGYDGGYGGSPPTRGRGLKLLTVGVNHWLQVVAPHAGAWIETGEAGAD